MAQPAVLNRNDHSDILGVPVFWPRSIPGPHFGCQMVGQFFLAITFREHYDPNKNLIDSAEVFDDSNPRQRG